LLSVQHAVHQKVLDKDRWVMLESSHEFGGAHRSVQHLAHLIKHYY